MHAPFKLLDPYGQEDRDRFFGREKESAQLFNAVFATHLTLLYGASGTGKTSLVQCGLGNLLHDSDWLPLFVRRGRDLNASLAQSLVQALDPENPQDRQAFAALETTEKIRLVYRDHYRPVFLIFDQFEELLILGQEAEKQRFYEDIRRLLESSLQVKVVIIIREEWIAWLNGFEKVVPKLFDNRLRIEKMNDRSLSRVVAGTLREAGIGLREPVQTVGAMLENLRDPREGVDLTHLQVYLDRLYRQAAKTQQGSLYFDPALVQEAGKLSDALAQFLDEQTEEADKKSGVNGLTIRLLFRLVTDEGTRQPLLRSELLSYFQGSDALPEADIQPALDHLAAARLLRVIALEAPGQPGQLATGYELAHDMLAQRVYARVSENEKNRRRIESLLEQRYRDHQQSGELLSAEVLAKIAPYEEELHLTAEIRSLISRSRKQIRNRQQRVFVVAGVLALLAVVSIVIYTQLRVVRNIQESLRLILQAQQEAATDPTQALQTASQALALDRNEVVLQGAYDLYRTHTFYHTLYQNNAAVLSAAPQPGGGWALALAGEDTRIIRLDGQGKALSPLEGHYFSVNEVVYSPDGRYLLSGSSDGSVRLWEAGSGAFVRSFETFRNTTRTETDKIIEDIAVSPDGKWVAYSASNRIGLGLTETGADAGFFTTVAPVLDLVFSPDNQWLIAATAGGYAQAIQLSDTTRRQITLQDGGSVQAVTFVQGGKTAAFALDSLIVLWDVAGDSLLRSWKAHTGAALCLAVSPGGDLLISGGEDALAKVWDLSGRLLYSYKGHRGPVLSVGFLPDMSGIFSSSLDGSLRTWDLPAYPLRRIAFDSQSDSSAKYYRITDALFAPDGKSIFTLADNGSAFQWSREGEILKRFSGAHRAALGCLAVSEDGRFLLTGSEDSSLVLWDVGTGEALQAFSGHNGGILSAVLLPDGSVLSSALDSAVIHWARDGKPIRRFAGQKDIVYSLAAGGSVIAGGSADSSLLQWSLGGDLQKIYRMEGPVVRVAVSGEGQILASAEHPLKALARIEGGEIHYLSFPGTLRAGASLGFSGDASLFLSAAHSGHVILWDRGGYAVWDMPRIRPRLLRVGLSSAGSELLFADGESLWLWHLNRLPLAQHLNLSHRHTN